MKAVIVNFRRSRHTQKPTHLIIKVGEVDNRKKAIELVGKEVSWKSPANKEIKGKIASAHGNKGCVRAIFEKGLPGQSLGSNVEIR